MKKEKEKNGQGKTYQLNQILAPVNDSVSKLHFLTQDAPASSFMIVKNKISVIHNTPLMIKPFTPKSILALLLKSCISLCLSHIEIYKAKYIPILKQILPTRYVLFLISVSSFSPEKSVWFSPLSSMFISLHWHIWSLLY